MVGRLAGDLDGRGAVGGLLAGHLDLVQLPQRPALDQPQRNDNQHQHRPRRQRRMTPRPLHQPLEQPGPPATDRLAVEVAFQVVGQFARAGVAVGGVLLQALQADRLQVARHPAGCGRAAAIGLCSRTWSSVSRAVSRLERRPAGEQFVEDGAQRVDVGGRGQTAVRPAACSGAMYDGVPRIAPVCVRSLRTSMLAGQAEVGDQRLARVVEQDVGRLQVAVDDAALVGVMHGAGDLLDQRGRRRRRRRGSASMWSARLPPGISFIEKNGRPSSSPTS